MGRKQFFNVPRLQKGERTYIIKVFDGSGKPFNRSTGITEKDEDIVAGRKKPSVENSVFFAHACDLSMQIETYRRTDQWDLINKIISKEITLTDLRGIRAEVSSGVESEKKLGEMIVAHIGRKPLSYWLDRWEAEHDALQPAFRGRRANPRQKGCYIRQLRDAILPDAADLYADWLTSDNIQMRIGDMPHATATKNTYRTAVSQFCQFLLRPSQKQLAHNPVRGQVVFHKTDAETKARAAWTPYTEADARALCSWVPGPDSLRKPGSRRVRHVNPRGTTTIETYHVMVALMMAAGIEYGAAARMTKEDFFLADALHYEGGERVVHAPGTKNKNRDRPTSIDLDWAWQIVRNYAMTLQPGAYVLPRAVTGTRAEPVVSDNPQSGLLRRMHDAACRELGVENRGFHRFRHSHTMLMLEQADSVPGVEDFAKAKLGHGEFSEEMKDTYRLKAAIKRTAAMSVRVRQALNPQAEPAPSQQSVRLVRDAG